jgi:hypothetical protein
MASIRERIRLRPNLDFSTPVERALTRRIDPADHGDMIEKSYSRQLPALGQVADCAGHDFSIVMECANADIACRTKQPTDFPGDMIMVNAEVTECAARNLCFWPPADRTDSALVAKHLVIVVTSDAVVSLPRRSLAVVASIGVVRVVPKSIPLVNLGLFLALISDKGISAITACSRRLIPTGFIRNDELIQRFRLVTLGADSGTVGVLGMGYNSHCRDLLIGYGHPPGC